MLRAVGGGDLARGGAAAPSQAARANAWDLHPHYPPQYTHSLAARSRKSTQVEQGLIDLYFGGRSCKEETSNEYQILIVTFSIKVYIKLLMSMV